MRGTFLKRQLLMELLFSFLVGILYVNLAIGASGDTGEFFGDYFFEQYQNIEIDSGKYILYLLRVRVVPLAFMTALSFTRFRRVAVWGFIGWTGFLGGFLMALAVLHIGIKGSLFCVLGVFPQIILYIPAYIVVLWFAMNVPQSHWDMQKTVFITGSMLSGILAEAFVNPVIMKLFVAIL